MKHMLCGLLSLCLLCCFFPAMADDAGVLSETELSQWINQVLRESSTQQPMNAPVGEESLTQDGYAFLYDFATLYYDRPQLDAASILQAVTVTDESYAAPRGITLGTSQEALISTFGWQNPMLIGDGTFATFYRLNELPRAAYWSWAQHDGAGEISRVQCAMYVQAGQDRYTDAGMIFELENGVVTDIRIYGLHDFITEAEVRSNLTAVMNVEAAGAGHLLEADGYAFCHDAPVFETADLTFSGITFPSLDITALEKALGEQVNKTEKITSGDEQIITAEWAQAYLSGTADGGMDVLSIFSDCLAGPRGVTVGQTLDEVIALFSADGKGRTDGQRALLYGDGVNAPFGTLEVSGTDAVLSYALQSGEENITLMLQFMDGTLQEWTLFTW